MRTNFALFLAGLIPCLFLSACSREETAASRVNAVRLFDIFEPDDLAGEVTPADAGIEPTEWSAGEMTPWKVGEEMPALGFRALHDLGELTRSDTALSGAIQGKAPVLQWALQRNRGGSGPVKAVEVRMKVAGAGEVWLRTEGEREVDDSRLIEWAGSTNWSSTAKVSDDSVQTYRFELGTGGDGRPRGGGPPPGPPSPDNPPPPGAGPPPPGGLPPMGGPPPGMPRPDDRRGPGGSAADLRHVFLTFRDCQDASFAIESIRLVTEKEEKLKEPSGQQWAGLGNIFRETLAAKSSETLRIPLRELPDRPWLDLAIGTAEDDPVTFTVSVTPRQGSGESSARVLLERTVTTPDRWQPLRIDLGAYAGKSIVMELALSGDRKGLWGCWGAPVIRGSVGAPPTTARASSARKPRGVIFLVADTLRPDHLNIYGYERPTVIHLKQFAEEGVAFRHAVSQGTWTKVSQPSMVTSLYPISHGVLNFSNSLPASAETLAEVYREAGYATVCYSSVMFTGKMNNMHQGYEELHERNSLSDEGRDEYNSKTSRAYVDRFIPWLEQHKDAPFFAYLHVFDPHSPFRPRPPYDTLWARPEDRERIAQIDEDIRKFKVKNAFGLPAKEEYVSKTGNDPDELLRIYKDWYDGSIRGMDAEIGRLLQALREMGLDQDTLIVFASDHGEEFWEHGKLFHGQSVYGELSQVPLVFRWPGHPDLRPGAMVDRLVENVDIMPTLLELSGLAGPGAMQGRSLVPLLNGSGEASWTERLAVTQTMIEDKDDPAANGPHFGFIENGLKVVRKELKPDLVEELYHRATDPLDLQNLIGSEGQRQRADALTETFAQWRTRMEAAMLPGDEEIAKDLSSEELRRLQALGYVGGGVKANDQK